MKRESFYALSAELDQCITEIMNHCSHDCHNCDYGVMQGYGYSSECVFELASTCLCYAAGDFNLIEK